MRRNESQLGAHSRSWARALLGIGVSIPVALAPLLGRLDVPLFTPLLGLIPDDIQEFAITISAAAMSLVAASVEIRAVSRSSSVVLQRKVTRTLLYAGICLAGLGIAYALLVTRVPYAGDKSAAFVTGFVHHNTSPCVDMSAEECIRFLTFDDGRIKSHFGEQQVRLANVLLVSFYTLFFALFGNLIGLVIALQNGKSKE
jgi:hypothetical protein